MGFLLSGVSMLGPWVAASRRWRTSSNCTRDLQLLCEELSRQLGLLQTVKVVVDPREYGPLATGLWNPTVVLPACLVEANDEVNLRMSMAHELVHLRRYDTAYSVMQCLVRAVWWFHPGVWWIGRLMDQAAERCCDEEVIAALECKPTLYARSLVAILEKKLQVRQVAILPGSRPGVVTADRLTCLKKPSSGFCRRTPWQYWLVFFALVFLIVPARPTFSAPDRVETTATTTTQLTQPSEHNDAAAAFSLGEYALAAKQYRQIVEAQPQNAFAWSRLGFSLHALERWDEAMVAHRKASKFPLTQATATYNIACVHSRLGNLDESIKALEKAIELGFRRERPVILQDPDLKTLREHPKFESLVAKASVTKRASRYRDLDFMLGKWQVKDPNGRLLGHSRITKEERGFLLTEKWTAIDGSTGTGITYFDPKLQAWRQTFVGMFGGVINAKGNLVDGTLKMTGDNSRPTRDISLLKTLTEPVAKGAFKFIIDESTDDGITWNRTFNGYYTSDDQP